jgi:two-component system phosphate regulon sensor histidine kinase PhoR
VSSPAPLRLGVRGKLFLISLALICATGAISSVYLEFELRRGLETSLAEELTRHAHSAATMLEAAPPGADLNALARQLGQAIDVRITALDETRIIADSADEADFEHIQARPEIVAARDVGQGRASMRHDQANPMLFVAVKTRAGPIVRAGKPLVAVAAAIDRMRTLLLVAVALGLIVALFMSGLASYLFARPLKTLVDHAHALANGPAPSTDLNVLNSSAHRLSTELESTIDDLADERDRIEAVLEGITEAVFGIDADDRITFVNSAAQRLVKVRDPKGKSIVSLIPELGTASRDEEGSLPLTLADQRHFIARVTDMRDGQIVTMLDVTRLRRLEQIRRDFVANVSHELRTPVSVIRANAETLLSGAVADPRQAEQFIDAMGRNAERLSDMIADLLNIARIEAGKYTVELGRTTVIEPAVIAYEQVEQLALDKGTTLDFQLEEGLVAHADANALSHVLTNLLENAIKYTPPGSAVVLHGTRTAEDVRLEIRDDGPGIPVEHRPRVFERFYRIDPGRSKEAGGTGLGLAIVKHLVMAMGGKVGVEPNAPRGSTFWVALPAA